MINIFLIIIILISFILSLYNLFINSNIFIKFLAIILILISLYSIIFDKLLLPFLGTTVYPPSLIPFEIYPPNTNHSLNLNFNYPDGTKVIYWAADNNGYYNNPNDAYGDYNNSGVAIVNNGIANLRFKCPSKYKIPIGTVLNKHIHYRIAFQNNPILSPVMTTYIKC
jgi:hypothetical protein